MLENNNKKKLVTFKVLHTTQMGFFLLKQTKFNKFMKLKQEKNAMVPKKKHLI